MGIISNIGVLRKLQQIKNGERAELSISQIESVIINLPDACKKLTREEYGKVFALYDELAKCKTKMSMDITEYYSVAVDIIKRFDKIAPYEKYSGGNEQEFTFLMDEIRGKNYKEIKEKRAFIAKMEGTLSEMKTVYAENVKTLKEAYTDEQLKYLLESGQFTKIQYDEYRKNRDAVSMGIYISPMMIKNTEDIIEKAKRELKLLENEQ